jgi:uncharacterized protein YbjT (DUF2867 family)
MARDPGKLSDRPWSGAVEVVAADALDRTGVRQALEDVDVAYYLIHSLGTGASFEQRDRDAAGIFADAAKSAGVSRIVYLGGIVPGDGSGLSPHLRSRAEVGDILLGGAHWNWVGTPSMTLRSPQQIARFFDGLDLLEPGVVSCSRWRPGTSPLGGQPPEVDEFCGVARKPKPATARPA